MAHMFSFVNNLACIMLAGSAIDSMFHYGEVSAEFNKSIVSMIRCDKTYEHTLRKNDYALSKNISEIVFYVHLNPKKNG